MKKIFETLAERVTSPTPAWFGGIIKLSLTLAAVGGALLGAEAAIEGYHLPHKIELLAQYFMVAGLVGGAISKTSSTNH